MPDNHNKTPSVYLAGPIVFYENPSGMFEAMAGICARHGLKGVSPLDNQMGLEEGVSGRELTLKIAQADFELMDQLDGGIFCMDSFRRAPEMDVGTAVEIGYMKSRQVPMSGWSSDPRYYPERVKDYFSKIFSEELTPTLPNDQGGTSGTHRDPDGMLVHSEGMIQNAMAQGAIELAGGTVHTNTDWQKAFEEAVIDMKRQFARI